MRRSSRRRSRRPTAVRRPRPCAASAIGLGAQRAAGRSEALPSPPVRSARRPDALTASARTSAVHRLSSFTAISSVDHVRMPAALDGRDQRVVAAHQAGAAHPADLAGERSMTRERPDRLGMAQRVAIASKEALASAYAPSPPKMPRFGEPGSTTCRRWCSVACRSRSRTGRRWNARRSTAAGAAWFSDGSGRRRSSVPCTRAGRRRGKNSVGRRRASLVTLTVGAARTWSARCRSTPRARPRRGRRPGSREPATASRRPRRASRYSSLGERLGVTDGSSTRRWR